MKKIFNLVVGGLQQKIFNLVIIAMLLTVAVYTTVVAIQTRKIWELAIDTTESQEETIEEISTSAMEDVIVENLGRANELEAYIINEVFDDLAGDVMMLADFAEKIFSNPSAYPAQSVDYPDASLEGTITVQLATEKQVDPETPAVARNIGIAGNMSDMLISLYASSNVNSCYIGTPDGVIIMADDNPSSKFDDNGNLKAIAVRKRAWYTGAVETGDIFFTDVVRDSFTDNIGIACSKPVYVNGELVAVVGVDFYLDSMQSAIETSDGDGDGFVCIINGDGHVIFSPEKSGIFMVETADKAVDLRESDEKELAAFVKEALAGQTEVRAVNIGDESYYMAGSAINSVGWAVVSVVESETVNHPTQLMLEQYAANNASASKLLRGSLGTTLRSIIVFTLIVLLIGIAGALSVARRIVRPLNTITKRIASLGGNNLQFKMEDTFRTGDEIEVLAESFAKLSAKTLQYVDEVTKVTAEKERISSELGMATAIQASQLPHLFPPFPDRKEFDIYASMTPAKEVGGDFYDFFLVDHDHIALVIADVSGKGVPAALFMMISKILIRNRMQDGDTPGEALANVNNQILEGNEAGMFVTVWLAVVDVSNGKGVAVNAGHEHPTLRKSGGRYELIKYRHSPAVATMEDMMFREHEFELEPGDSIFVYTDGVAEATNSENELFGTDRMLEVLNKDPDAAPDVVLSNMMEGINNFVAGAEQFDDITMLSFKYNGN